MLEELERLSRHFISLRNRPFRRYFLGRWPLDSRFSIIVGPRGVGKTTCMIQFLGDHLGTGPSRPEALYVQVDHVKVGGADLYEIAVDFHQLGGKLLCLDEIHKYPGWERQLKSIHDTFPDLRLVASGSSALEIHRGTHDLSRRAVVYPMEILSFREYLALRHHLQLDPFSLDELLRGHEA